MEESEPSLASDADCLSLVPDLDLSVVPFVAKERSLSMGPDGLSVPRRIG